jgi:hypothetical protein
MTRYGPDISSYQAGLDLSRLQHASFVIAKTTEGTYYDDPDYDAWRRQAATLGLPFIWYHFLTTEATELQLANNRAHIGDPALLGMLDCEPRPGKPGPTFNQIMAYVRAAHSAQLRLGLVYLPRWYWEQIGSPDLRPLAGLGVELISSSYVSIGGSPDAIYPGDTAAGWESYGGMEPVLYQFTNQASDGGQLLDYNAFRGDDATFSQLFHPSQGDDMPACMNGEINPGAGARTIVTVPPANFGSASWGNVWFSLGSDFGTAHVRVAAYIHGVGWHVIDDVAVPADGDRVNPFGGPLPQATQKISIVRNAGPDVPLGWLVEAAAR